MRQLQGGHGLELQRQACIARIRSVVGASRVGARLDEPLVLEDGIAIGHTGDVIANSPMKAACFDAFACLFTQLVGVCEIELEKGFEHSGCAKVWLVDYRVEIEIAKQVITQLEVEHALLGTVGNKGPGPCAGVIGAFDAGGADELSRGFNHVTHGGIDETSDNEVTSAFVGEIAVIAFDHCGCAPPQCDVLQQMRFVKQTRIQAIVKVVTVISDFVGKICDLCLERTAPCCEPAALDRVIVACVVF